MLKRWQSWIPTGGGLRDEDWARRHRLLTLLLAASVGGLTIFGAFRDALAAPWLTTVLLMLACVVAAARLRSRRLASIAVAVGLNVLCGGFVSMSDGLTEAHFSFFIAVAALALYRDWAPFGVFLVGTTLHHAVFGTLVSEHTYDHAGAAQHPLLWAALHGGAVLLAAGFQLVQWALTEDEERRAQENLDDREAQLSVAFDETPVPMAMLSPDGLLLRTNSAYRALMRLPDELPAGFGLADLPVTPVGHTMSELFDVLTSDTSYNAVRQYQRTDDGEMIWADTHSTSLFDKDGRLKLVFVHAIDVTESRRQQEELRHRVRHDSLTGLLSRSAFESDLPLLLAGDTAAVLYIDVDRFKSINDGSGHAAGDDVLKAIAARLSALVPAGSLITRVGGDEFIVAVPGGAEAGAQVGEAALAAFAEPLPVDDNLLNVSLSIGLAMAADAGCAEDAVLAADTAMYAAKRAGGNRVKVFNQQMRVSVQERITGEKMLREALAGDRQQNLPVWFQPIVRAEDGEIVGAEALVRMCTADGTILGPGHFIPAAEETGLIVPLGEHVLRTALRYLQEWSDDLRYISVNVSPRQLAEADFVPLLADLLTASPEIDPRRLVLEITETAMLGSSHDVRERLETIKALGVRIALDDFGTGYSSLTWLQNIPADVVKLDRSFVAGLSSDPRKSSIIQAVLWMARSLGMSAVAEGVEEEADQLALHAAGCPFIQGYLFGKPVPPAEFSERLQRSRMATTP
ncbi:putative bifunctional diguanylate cyclase/phosphodiesterase [Paractinoplanes ferrugineus]|uniref:putative bifunctional diguanylate cyclase/phosphodiesterase n=1 Tax=Paractinoplanes ferrugineus TaxID=113564 RepID=UPI001EF1AB6A|nr:EAL domain-containing protein [Actinoplanes ferrugineus]